MIFFASLRPGVLALMLFQAPADFAGQIAEEVFLSEIIRLVVKLHDDMNHDELFKSLLKTGRLLRDFFEAFLPKLCSILTGTDFSRWLKLHTK